MNLSLSGTITEFDIQLWQNYHLESPTYCMIFLHYMVSMMWTKQL